MAQISIENIGYVNEADSFDTEYFQPKILLS